MHVAYRRDQTTLTEPLGKRSGPPGLWVPDEVLERAPAIGGLALLVLLLLGRADSLAQYPSARGLALEIGCREEAVWEALQRLYDAGAVNDADARAVQSAGERDGWDAEGEVDL